MNSKIDLRELNKLEQHLKKNGYRYERIDDDSHYLCFHQLIVYDQEWNRRFDVVCHFASYGGRQGLLETMGYIVPKGKEIEGNLTADDVIARMREHGI